MPRSERQVRSAIALLALVAIGASAFAGRIAIGEGSALRDRVALILQPASADGPILPPGESARDPEAALTALRALRELGLSDDIPPGSVHTFEDGLARLAGNLASPPQSVSDLIAAQNLGGAREIAVPGTLREALRVAAVPLIRAAPTEDPNVASDRLLVVRAARDVGAIPTAGPDAGAWCELATEALASARLDIAALFAEMASPDPRTCQIDQAAAGQWVSAAQRAIEEPEGQLAALAYLAPAVLSTSERASAGEHVLETLDADLRRGEAIPLRVIELAARLGGPHLDVQRAAEPIRLLRRAVLLVGAAPDQIVATAWDRIIGTYVTTEVGLPTAYVGVQPAPSSGLAGPPSERVLAALGLSRGTDELPHPGNVADLAEQPWLLAALSWRTGDCGYLHGVQVSASDDLPAGRQLVNESLLLVELDRCASAVATGLAATHVAALAREDDLRRILDTPAPSGSPGPTANGVIDLWAAAESSCLLGMPVGEDARSRLRDSASVYLEGFASPTLYLDYSPDALYAALRLRHLASGCDSSGWWAGSSASP